jgi:parallel beta-helix repeat protein
MQAIILWRRDVAWVHRLIPATIALGLLLVLVFGFSRKATAQVASAQSINGPLNFANNYFVRGDYVVAGAYGMTSHLMNGFATGTINIPDSQNKGITGPNQVPADGEVIAAVLYWQTVEKVGQLGTGQNGFFRPVLTNGTGPLAPGYPISGVNLPSHSTVSFSSGGCSGSSTGKVVQTYRANVLGALPRDKTGNIAANGQYEVRLPSVGNNTPLTLGATLVLVYRVLDPNVPLNAIVFYDGAFAPTASSPTISQTVTGFYDAFTGANSTSSVTYIVAHGQSNKFETVSFNGKPLSSLYGQNLPYFPGWYDAWDTVRRNFPQTGPNPLTDGQSSVPTQVTATSMNAGCVSWGAMIVSTTVKNTDGDALLDSWKTNLGYCDAVALDAGTCSRAGDPGWVDLPNATTPGSGIKDVYIQLDYMCSSPNADGNTCKTGDGTNYSFDPRPSGAIGLVAGLNGPFAAHNIHLHINETVPNRPKVANVHAIPEGYCQDTLVNGQLSLCAFPNPPGTNINRGVVAWPGGFLSLKSQLVDLDQPLNLNDCANSAGDAKDIPPDCVPRFQPGAAPSKHEVIFAHAVGQPKWRLQDSTLTSVSQLRNTVTFTTSMPVGTLNILGTDANGKPVSDPSCPTNGRVTIVGAATNPNLNGTYCVGSPFDPNSSTFSIPIGGSPTTESYTFSTDPNLAVAPGFTSTASGVSDVGGANSLITLGLWGNPAFDGSTLAASPASDGQQPLVVAGTFLHENGHGLGLAHGAPAALVAQGQQTLASALVNCKPNYLSVMSYSRQVDGVLDYSEAALDDLSKTTQKDTFAADNNATTNWYVPWPNMSVFDTTTNQLVPLGSPAKLLCNGGPIPNGAQPKTQLTGPASTFSFLSPDINFDGNATEDLQGSDDWHNLDFALGATGAISSSSGGQFNGGGGQFNGGGGQFNGGGGQFNGGGGQFNGGGGQFNGGGGQFNGGGEVDLRTEDAITHVPQQLQVSEAPSPRTITLQWIKPFGDIGAYNVYRSKNGGPFTIINAANTTPPHTLVGTPPATTFTDTVTCEPGGYRYFVTAVQSNTSTNPGQESTQSNTVSTILPDTTDKLTGCYTFTGFSSPAAGSSAVRGSLVPITWSVQDDLYTKGAFVSNTTANTLVAIGPVSNDTLCGSPTNQTNSTTILSKGTPAAQISVSTGPTFKFTFNWDTTAFPEGCYVLELDLDSGQPTSGGQPASAFQTLVYLSDVSLGVTPTSLPNANEGVAYNAILSETGGTTGGAAPFSWIVVAGSLPNGMSLAVAPDGVSGALSGTPTTPGVYTFTVKVTDSIGDFGTQALTLIVNAVVINTNDSGAGSLRQAILDVNAAQAGPQPIGIIFNIPGTGVQTISPATALPALVQPTILDGKTQTGYTNTPLIELNGSNSGASIAGLHIVAGNSTVRGLAIYSFNGDEILIDTNGGDVIQGNYIGTNAAGTAQPNGGNGIQIVATPNNVIGGMASSMRNLISGNGGEGLRIDGTLATGNIVQGNYIGTDASGSSAVGNNASGIYIRRASGNSVIGNVVSGNLGFAGIAICGTASFCGGGDPAGIDETSNAAGNVVQGNFVGTNFNGTSPLGNNGAGLSIDGAPNTQVGGTTSAMDNIISFNGTNDVQIFDTGAISNKIQGNTIQGKPAATTVGISVAASLTGNTLSQNSISGHGGLGIDLAPTGVNPNVTGAANNYPVISSAQVASGTITGTLNGPANSTFTIEFFSNTACNGSLNGEGATFLGSTPVTTDSTGNASFSIPVSGLMAGSTITATSTDSSGTTSEFSQCVTAN